MPPWLTAALDYIPSWIDYQMQVSGTPGCLLAVVHRGEVVLERGFGVANLDTGEKLTPRHRFRVASHAKTFTAAGILKLREQKRLRLDDTVGSYVDGLHTTAAEATITQLLSHTGGLCRDGADSSYFQGLRPFPRAEALKKDLAAEPIIEAGLRVKYSNHGYGLLGLVIVAVTGAPYKHWIEREVVAAAGLKETTADMPLKRGTPFARGHSAPLVLGRRLVLPGDMHHNALAPASGFVSTAADIALFFNQLAPGARSSILSTASRRDMVRRHWRLEDSSTAGHYGLGMMSATQANWDWFGHSGGMFGYGSRTVTLPAQDLTFSLLCNADDSWVHTWSYGLINLLRTFFNNGEASRHVRDWAGRWWNASGAVDLVPMGNKVFVGWPGQANHPFLEATEIEVTSSDNGRILRAGPYAHYGEPVRRKRNGAGEVTEVWTGPLRFVPQSRIAGELKQRYGRAKSHAKLVASKAAD
jgi:CubicO group peptidase (beta-lactamase class C family)